MRRMSPRIRMFTWIVALCGGLSMMCAAQSEQPQPQSSGTARSEGKPGEQTAPKPKAKHVFTNDDIPSSADADKAPTNAQGPAPRLVPKLSADEVRGAIREQKEQLAKAQAARDKLQKLSDQLPKSDCRHLYYPDDPKRDVCADFTKIPAKLKEAQERVDKEQAKLELMQQNARKMGYGSSVYDAN